jgi:hypothetical protein
MRVFAISVSVIPGFINALLARYANQRQSAIKRCVVKWKFYVRVVVVRKEKNMIIVAIAEYLYMDIIEETNQCPKKPS